MDWTKPLLIRIMVLHEQVLEPRRGFLGVWGQHARCAWTLFSGETRGTEGQAERQGCRTGLAMSLFLCVRDG